MNTDCCVLILKTFYNETSDDASDEAILIIKPTTLRVDSSSTHCFSERTFIVNATAYFILRPETANVWIVASNLCIQTELRETGTPYQDNISNNFLYPYIHITNFFPWRWRVYYTIYLLNPPKFWLTTNFFKQVLMKWIFDYILTILGGWVSRSVTFWMKHFFFANKHFVS